MGTHQRVPWLWWLSLTCTSPANISCSELVPWDRTWIPIDILQYKIPSYATPFAWQTFCTPRWTHRKCHSSARSACSFANLGNPNMLVRPLWFISWIELKLDQRKLLAVCISGWARFNSSTTGYEENDSLFHTLNLHEKLTYNTIITQEVPHPTLGTQRMQDDEPIGEDQKDRIWPPNPSRRNGYTPPASWRDGKTIKISQASMSPLP